MLKITKPMQNRVDITLKGQIDAENMEMALDSLIEMSEDVSDGVMLYRIPEFAMPTMGAIGVEMRRLPKLFSLIGKFKRCAVLTDAGWLKTAAEIEGALLPGLEIKAFDLDDVDEAEAWLNA